MSPKDAKNDNKLNKLLAEARRESEQGYRERALKMFPWICGRCAREFTVKRLRELTVHHKDHNHDNNPSDGSNWELLCLYCHDNEHARDSVADAYTSDGPAEQTTFSTHRPFADLDALLKGKL